MDTAVKYSGFGFHKIVINIKYSTRMLKLIVGIYATYIFSSGAII